MTQLIAQAKLNHCSHDRNQAILFGIGRLIPCIPASNAAHGLLCSNILNSALINVAGLAARAGIIVMHSAGTVTFYCTISAAFLWALVCGAIASFESAESMNFTIEGTVKFTTLVMEYG